jgi:hypothetical protein
VSGKPGQGQIGINTGDPLEEDNDYYGHVVNLAARLCEVAKGGQIVVSAVVRELAAGQKFQMNHLNKLELKGIGEPVDAFSVVWRAGREIDGPLRTGDIVEHARFGVGVVISATPSGKDHQVVVSFDGEAGIKKLLLSFAPLKKLNSPPPAPKDRADSE